MNPYHLLVDAFTRAKSLPDQGTESFQVHRHRSRNFVEELAGEFRQAYKSDAAIAVLSKHCPDNRDRFGLNELLYDILVCRTGTTTSAQNGETLSYVTEAVWLVESEFARDSREAVYDFNKLVIGSSEHKLFIGPRSSNQVAYLEPLATAARHCAGHLWLALVPHPSAWTPHEIPRLHLWKWDDGRWREHQSGH